MDQGKLTRFSLTSGQRSDPVRANLSWLAIATLLGGCATTAPIEPTIHAGPVLTRPVIACSDGSSIVDNDFAGSAMAGCQVVGDGHYRLLIRQEDRNVTNCSAWYAFRIQAPAHENILVDLDYEKCGHRYLPKIWVAPQSNGASEACDVAYMSGPQGRLRKLIFGRNHPCDQAAEVMPSPGANWEELPVETYAIDGEGNGVITQARLALTARPNPQIVSSQELLLPQDYKAWLDNIESGESVQRSELGRSLEGQQIELIEIQATEEFARGQLVLVGRQHPPEVTGAFALFAFVERLLEDDDLAQRYRARFTTIIVPMLNPDGVVRGHWRHSKGERDLNRDWGPFTQPETRLVRDMMEAIDADTTKDLRFFVDFHSTDKDVLYTLDKSLVTNPPGYTDDWISDYQSRLPGYTVVEQPGHNPDSPVSKGWAFERFGIPSMTYEIGDETDRALIRMLGRAAAEATMTTLLAHDSASE